MTEEIPFILFYVTNNNAVWEIDHINDESYSKKGFMTNLHFDYPVSACKITIDSEFYHTGELIIFKPNMAGILVLIDMYEKAIEDEFYSSPDTYDVEGFVNRSKRIINIHDQVLKLWGIVEQYEAWKHNK